MSSAKSPLWNGTLSVSYTHLERQLRKYKNKLIARQQEGGNFQAGFFEAEQDTSDSDKRMVVL